MVKRAIKALKMRRFEIKGFKRVEKVALVPPSFSPGAYISDRSLAKTGFISDMKDIIAII